MDKEKIKGGLADGKPDSKYDKKQLEKGRKVEKEHTNDPKKAKEIAKDHLEECDDYYTRLEKLENECKNTKENTKKLEKKMKSTAKKDKKKGRCWEGYEPVPGKEPYSEDSCKKKSAMKLAQVIKNHLSGEQSEQSRVVFSKISSKLQEAGYRAPFKVIAFGESWERVPYVKNDHIERVESMDNDALQYTLNELNDVIEKQEEMRRSGHAVEKLGYYHDERHHIIEEIVKRKKAGTWNTDPNDGDFEQDLNSKLSPM